jgi:hypothetical protein
MNSSGHLPVSESAAKRVRKAKTQRKAKARPRTATAKVTQHAPAHAPAAGTLARTKSLLLAAIRVWELKHRVTLD